MVFSFGALATGIVIIFSALAITTLACVAFQGIGISGVLVRIRVAHTGTWGGTRHCTAARGCGARRVTASGKWGETRGRNVRKKREEKRGENVKRNTERNTERNVTDSGETTAEKRGRQWRNVRSCIALCTGKVQRGLTCPKRRRPHRCGCQTGNRYLSGYCNRGEYIEKNMEKHRTNIQKNVEIHRESPTA